MTKGKITIVVPVYNEAENLSSFYKLVSEAIPANYNYEIILVDDGSSDDSLLEIKQACAANPNIRYAALSRNFGHQLALKAGIDLSDGDCTITLDADFQHPVDMLPQMIREWETGSDVVNMIRIDKKQWSFKTISSRLFYYLISKVSDFPIKPGSADFRLMDKQVTDSLKEMKENTIFLRGLIPWMGFRQKDIYYLPQERHAGESKYNLKKMLRLALIGIVSSSTKPLRLATYTGLTIALIASFYAIYAIIIKVFVGTAISGWTSMLISVLLLSGTQLIMLGIIGEYLGKNLIESKGRPNYIIREQNILEGRQILSVSKKNNP